MERLRLYSETAPEDALTAVSTLRVLAARDVELVLAVRPWDLARLPDLAARVTGAGVPLGLWPMVHDDDGRFLHLGNVARVRELALAALAGARARGGAPADVMLDLEPPVDALRAARHRQLLPLVRTFTLGRRLAAPGEVAIARLRDELAHAGVSVSCAVSPQALWDGAGGAFSHSLCTGAAEGFARVDVMTYTTLFQDSSFGLVGRRRALSILGAIASRATRVLGDRASIALGCVGTGALGDERVFASPAELAEDARAARSAGARRLALLDLGGALARGDLEAWLDAALGQRDS